MDSIKQELYRRLTYISEVQRNKIELVLVNKFNSDQVKTVIELIEEVHDEILDNAFTKPE